MDRSSGRASLVSRMLTVGAVAALALALQGCGPDAAGADAVLSAAVVVPDVGACRRFTSCVPENPCHTGWVTGCRRNVPVCTDIGGWLDNGTACGTGTVCFMGQCVPCAAGEACTLSTDMYGNPDPCRPGAIACGTGQPVCEPTGPAPDGTACAFGQCVAGQCTWCGPGAQCTLAEDPCHFGALTCATPSVCVPTAQPVPDGWGCGPDRTCKAGECVGCTAGEACTDPYQPCWSGQTVCTPYGTQCALVAPQPDGTSCPGGVCVGGGCNACGASSWCPPPNPCWPTGQVSCTTGACEPVGDPYADGTPCGPSGETCVAGVCSGVPGGRLFVRTASGGLMDMTGTVWSQCYANEPSFGTSRLATDSFDAGTFKHTDVVFTASLDCTGPTDPAQGLAVTAQTTAEGDRTVGWDQGAPPGLPPTVTATAVLLSGIDPSTGIPDPLRWLFFVNDLAAPQTLHSGDKERLAPDGYPTLLESYGRPRAAACTPGAPCQGTGGACGTWAIDCGSGAGACKPQGTAPDGASCGPAGEVCVFGTCTGNPGAPVIVRAASGGTVDLTGTTWTACVAGSPDPWSSRRTTDVYGPGTIAHAEEVYPASTDCTGLADPARAWRADGTLVSAGDRVVGWTNGTPPVPGLPGAVVATGVVVTATDPATGAPMSFQDLAFVDDAWESPRALYAGNGDGPLEADGFPAQLSNEPGREATAGRTITGARTVTFWPEAGPTAPFPAGLDAVSALVPDGAGGWTKLPGVAAPDGTFSIASVPEGAYLLRLDTGGVVYLAETDAGSVDMGFDVVGRPGLAWASGVPLTTSVTGLDPWTSGDLLAAYSASAGLAAMPFGAPGATGVPAGATEASATTTLGTIPLPEAAQGDVVQVFQARTAALGPAASYVAASSAGAVADATLTPAGPNAWTASLAPIVDQGAFTSSWPAPAYEAFVADMGPGATVQNHKIGVTAASHAEPLAPPFPGTYLGTAGAPLLVARAGAGFAGMDLADLRFGRFLPAPWTEYRDVRMYARVPLTVGGTTYVLRPSVARVELLATAPYDAAPLVSPPRDVRVNGLAATAPLAGVGTGPTLGWSPPAVGTPTSYAVRIQALPGLALAVSARTTGTTLRIPDGVLAPGTTYFAWITARLAPDERLDAPLRNAFGASTADTVTATFTP